MSCLLPLIAGVCLFEPSSLTLRAQASLQISGSERYYWGTTDYGGGHLGRLTAEMGVTITPSFSIAYGVEHQSLIDTARDRGEERMFMTLQWRPFAGR